jgi:predicted amidohydrolase YtcJ
MPFYFTWYYLDYKERTADGFVPENRHFRNGGIKLFSDGSLGSGTAWMFENEQYKDAPPISPPTPHHPLPPPKEGKTWGGQYLEQIKQEIMHFHKHGVQVAVHAIGDYAVYLIANMFIEINKAFPSKLRHRMEHLQAVRPEDIKLLKEANIHASMQPVHFRNDEELMERHWKVAKEYAFPLKSIINSGITLALGSDSPVETLNPFEGMGYALNLTTENTESTEKKFTTKAQSTQRFHKEYFKVTPKYAYTHHLIANKPITYGVIKKDMIANLIVVKKGLDSYIKETELTMIDGVIVYRK